jgi:hypothetical protein
MCSGGVIYVPFFMKIGSGVQKLIRGGIHRHTHKKTHTDSNVISLAYFIFSK